MNRAPLGSWTTPGGNNVLAFYRPIAADQAVIDMEWDTPPPLSIADEAHYLTTIRPQLISRIREYTEMAGGVMVLDV